MEELRNKLLDWAKQFETPDFIKDDPIFFPHKYNDKKDIEISVRVTTMLSVKYKQILVA
jgi:hypothetical protein